MTHSFINETRKLTTTSLIVGNSSSSSSSSFSFSSLSEGKSNNFKFTALENGFHQLKLDRRLWKINQNQCLIRCLIVFYLRIYFPVKSSKSIALPKILFGVTCSIPVPKKNLIAVTASFVTSLKHAVEMTFTVRSSRHTFLRQRSIITSCRRMVT